jgi:hypothetical protein
MCGINVRVTHKPQARGRLRFVRMWREILETQKQYIKYGRGKVLRSLTKGLIKT